MSSANAATGEAAGAADNKPGFVQQLRANPILPLIVGVALAVTVLAALLLWTGGPSYGVLYTGLSDSDGGEIIAQLDQMQVPYAFAANGSTIKVPMGVIDQTRLTLAGQGLPQGGGVGFELMDNQAFGISQFAEHVNYKRALQGELARSIETIGAVASARVHLAIPESSVFVRERELPSASVILDLYSGRILSDGQVSAIVHLVASSVTNLPVDAITVVDQNGRLLSAQGGPGNGIDGSQLEYVAQIENGYRESIEAILGPVVGRDNIRAQVVADIDFSVGERTEETYRPNQNPADAAIRSQQFNVGTQSGGRAIGGIPGALSNQPAPDVPSPINNPENPDDGDEAEMDAGALNMAGSGGFAPGPSGTADGPGSRSSTINYEVDRVIRHVRMGTGRVERVSAAVVINYPMQSSEDDSGEMQPVPLSDERMQQIESLVKEAIGFSAARGDSLEVVNVPFNEAPGPLVADAPPWWQDPQIIALAITGVQYLLIAIVAWLLWRKLVKPLLGQLPQLGAPQVATAGGPALPAGDYDDEGEGEPVPNAQTIQRRRRKKQHDELLKTTQDLARNDPKLVAMIIKSWMNSNA